MSKTMCLSFDRISFSKRIFDREKNKSMSLDSTLFCVLKEREREALVLELLVSRNRRASLWNLLSS